MKKLWLVEVLVCRDDCENGGSEIKSALVSAFTLKEAVEIVEDFFTAEVKDENSNINDFELLNAKLYNKPPGVDYLLL